MRGDLFKGYAFYFTKNYYRALTNRPNKELSKEFCPLEPTYNQVTLPLKIEVGLFTKKTKVDNFFLYMQH